MTFIEPPFNYTGSKFKLLSQIIPLFDKSKQNFVDLFSGGGSVYTNCLNFYETVYVNDIIADLVGIHKNIVATNGQNIQEVKSLCVSKDDQVGYNKLRESYNESPSPEKLFSLMLCCTNNMMRFNKKFKFNQTFGKRTFNDRTQQKIDNWLSHVYPHKDKIQYSSLKFQEFPKLPDTFYYLDPPYPSDLTEAGYNAYWSKEDDDNLIDFCLEITKLGSTFALSTVEIHDGKKSLFVEKLLSLGFKKIDLDYNYDKVSRSGKKETKEVLIVNYEV